jgi:outer membrane receptor protein involved in Fe transport
MVTATRRSTSVLDVPYNISAVTGAKIEAARMVDASELLRSIPGVAVSDKGARNAGQVNGIRIRGLNVDSANRSDVPVTSAPTVATYINDTPVFANMMLKDLERVEVLRGPQGTLYGSGALGGAVRYITKKPELGEFGGYVTGTASTTAGSDSLSWAGDLVVNVPLGETMALRAVASKVDTAGIIDYVNIYALDANGAPVVPGDINDNDAVYLSVKDADTVDIEYLRVSMLFEPSEAFDFTATYTRQTADVGSRRASAEGHDDGFGGEYGRYEAGSVQLEPAESDLDLFSAEMNVDLGFATLTSSTSYYERSGRSISENTGFYASKNWLAGFYYNSPRPLARADRGYTDEAFIQEVRLVSSNEGPFNWVLGGYYQDQETGADQISTLAGYKAWASQAFSWMSNGFGYSDIDNDFDYDSITEIKETALFGEFTYDVSDRLHLTAGFRWFDSSVSSDATIDLPFWNAIFDPAVVTDAKSGKKDTLFKVNASYDLSDTSMIYATVSEGYRRGGSTAVPLTGAFAEDPVWLTYGSDTNRNFELGFKGGNNDLRYTVAAFYVDWNNPQINTATTNWGFFTVANGDEATTKGIEVELEGYLSPAFHYQVGYAYVDAELSEDFIAPTGSLIAAKGNKLPGVPKHMLNIAFDYTKELSNGVDMVFRMDSYVQGKSENYINNASATLGETHGGFSIWNAGVSLQFESFDVSVFAKNLFNVRGTTASYNAAYMGTDPSQNYFGSGAKDEITLPRTIGAAVTYRF